MRSYCRRGDTKLLCYLTIATSRDYKTQYFSLSAPNAALR